MSDYMADVGNYIGGVGGTKGFGSHQVKDKSQLDMTDFLVLMVKEMTSQNIDSTADTSDMLNQLVQMQMVQALTNMTDASIMSYAASLVGKEITVGKVNSDGGIDEVVGVVTGTGTMSGKQVVFVGDEFYYMSEIMAVGRLPEKPADTPDGAEKPEGVEKPQGGETKPDSGDSSTTPEGQDAPKG